MSAVANITWMLQQGVLRHIQTFQRGYHPTDNVIMMSVEFGMANQFILDLSVNTKRGQRNKAQNGWLPTKAPIGYLNNPYNTPDNPPIYKDPKRFDIVKKLWDILLEKKCTLDELHVIANKMGLISYTDKTYAHSSFHRLFRNPFYYGRFIWNGDTYNGKHEAMITKTEFDLAQHILDKRGFRKKASHIFAFTGLIRCGACGASITAEDKEKHQKNGNVHKYSYYRCTKRINPDCSQKPITSKDLESQIINVLGKISIPPEFHQWAIKHLREEQAKEITDNQEITKAQRQCLDNGVKRLNTLFNMRLNGEITPEEFKVKNEELLKEKHKYEELLKDTSHRQETWLDRAERLFNFAETAKHRFENGSLIEKREILATLGSNLLLTDRTLKVPLDNDLAMFLEVAPEVQALHNRLEPLQVAGKSITWEDFYDKNKKWGLSPCVSRVSRDHSARLLVVFHKRRRERLEMSLDEPFAAERQPAPPVNVIQQALLVKTYMRANPEETCLSAAFKLNLNRKRIAKLLQIVDMLPKSFVKEAKNYTDPVILRRMSAGALSDVLQFADPEQVARKLQKLVTLPSPDPQK